MAGVAVINGEPSWTDRVKDYLSYRRSLGFSLEAEERYLCQFALFANRRRAKHLTIQLAMEWACTGKSTARITRAYKIIRLRGFAKYCLTFDPKSEIPPSGLFGTTHRRRVPHVFTEQEIVELLNATDALRPCHGLRPKTYRAIFGLLASTGLRLGEAIRLTTADVNLERGVLSIRDSKRHKSRFVPLHSSTTQALRRYAQQRDHCLPHRRGDSFFASDSGRPPSGQSVRGALHFLAKVLGLRARGDYPLHRPRDFRHTFIVRNMLNAFRSGIDIDRLVLVLSTYVGHDHVSDTYWYVTAVPELMAIAGNRFHHYIHDRVLQ